MNELYLFGGAWIACGFASYGLGVAYFQREYPSIAKSEAVRDRIWNAKMALLGPISLIVALLCSRFGKHGWML
jgi:hypothetical protein